MAAGRAPAAHTHADAVPTCDSTIMRDAGAAGTVLGPARALAQSLPPQARSAMTRTAHAASLRAAAGVRAWPFSLFADALPQ